MTQLALPVVLDRWEVQPVGPRGGSTYKLSLWLEQWRNKPVRLLHRADGLEIIVVPVDTPVRFDQATGFLSLT